MNWIRSHRRSSALLGLALALPVFLYLKLFFGVLGLGLDYAGERNRLEPRVARLSGLLGQEDLLARQSALADSQLRRLVFAPGEAPSALSARVQADVRQILLEASLSVTNSQVLPLRKDDQFDRVGVKLTAQGSLDGLDAALSGLAAYEPKLIIESLDTFPAAASRRNEPDETQQLTAVFQLTALKEAL